MTGFDGPSARRGRSGGSAHPDSKCWRARISAFSFGSVSNRVSNAEQSENTSLRCDAAARPPVRTSGASNAEVRGMGHAQRLCVGQAGDSLKLTNTGSLRDPTKMLMRGQRLRWTIRNRLEICQAVNPSCKAAQQLPANCIRAVTVHDRSRVRAAIVGAPGSISVK